MNTKSRDPWDEDEWPSPKDDMHAEIFEELASYTENFSRANEDGWFYSDRDEGLDAIPAPDSENN